MSLRRIILLSISVFLLLMSVIVYFERTRLSIYGQSDFFVFYQAVRFYLSGQDIYSSYIINNGVMYIREAGNLNAPFLALLLLPFSYVNYACAFEIWVFILMVCLLVGGYLALRPFPQWHKNVLPILALFLMFFPNRETIIYGQISPVLFLLVVSAWLLSRKGKDNLAGVFIGLACTLKLFCGLFLIYFLCLKRFRLFLISVLTFLSANGLAWLAFGTQAYISYYNSIKGIFWYAGTWNVSFHGFFMRLFSNAEHNVPLIAAAHWANIATMTCSALLMVLLTWVWRKEGEAQFDRGFSLVIVSMLLLSPLSWIYYFSLLLIPYLVIVSENNDWVHLAACILLLLSMKMPLLILASGIKSPIQIFWAGGLGFYILLGLLALLAKPYQEYARFTPRLWGVIYTLIFIAPIVVLAITFTSLTF
ncbi:MAG: glycosyltransferase family 87 protein [Gammaproteobacteria bacterium]|nr:glycosyltransferase family 87 protein [Gammaproteobacteria bacterium]